MRLADAAGADGRLRLDRGGSARVTRRVQPTEAGRPPRPPGPVTRTIVGSTPVGRSSDPSSGVMTSSSSRYSPGAVGATQVEGSSPRRRPAPGRPAGLPVTLLAAAAAAIDSGAVSVATHWPLTVALVAGTFEPGFSGSLMDG